ncbi:DUF4129 domain-containing protein [Haloarcula halophila]|uniref:DUF4129 domain-containing protein n=1 Tax=Haloarcula TaxID=2237 RepID=UPI0023E37F01|nr:DUF4129 domain-containing protein [Halomicroarcula sp. DFY41]
MSRRLSTAVVTGLVLLALVVGASALDAPARGGGESGGTDGNHNLGAGDAGSETPETGPVLLAITVAILLVVLAYGIRQYGTDDLVLAALTSVVLLVAALVVGFDPRTAGGGLPARSETVITEATSGPAQTSGSPWLFGLVGAVALVVLAGVLLRRVTGTESWVRTEDDTELEDGGEETEAATDVADAAGRAADRLAADEQLDNAVYRAWDEMTGILDVEDEASCTPREFAEAAVDAGLAADDVATLTELFETVRYSDSPATERREERAETALRNIERTYGGAS